MKLSLLLIAVGSMAAACSGASSGDDVDGAGADAVSKSTSASNAERAIEKSFDPNKLPDDMAGAIPGTDAKKAESAYANDSLVVKFKVDAAGKDAYAVLGNVVDADYEIALFDAKGALVASGTYFGFQQAKWLWDKTAQTASHVGDTGGVEAVKSDIAKIDPEKLPAEYKGTIPGADAATAVKTYDNDNFSEKLKLSAGGHDVYVVFGNIIDADYELAVFDTKGKLLASAQYFGFQGAKWVWDAKPQAKTHAG